MSETLPRTAPNSYLTNMRDTVAKLPLHAYIMYKWLTIIPR